MKRNFLSIFLPIVLLVTLVSGGVLLIQHFDHLPETISRHETIILGQNQLVPGSKAALRIVVRDSHEGTPLENAEVSLVLKDSQSGDQTAAFSGKTDAQGTLNASFTVPEEAAKDQTLVVWTTSSLGGDILEQPVTVERDYRVLLSSDKPIYQPGQIIHLRALALGSFDLKPAAGDEIEFVIADGKGNKVFRQTLETSEFGVASVDFQLASEAGSGNYKISATLGDVTSEKTVSVEFYVLPEFDIEISTDKTFYRPGETISGSLQADYFFGKPVANSLVSIEGYTFDFEKDVSFNLEGETDETGYFEFELALPEYIAGSDLEGGLGRYYLQVNLTDQAEHSETANLSLPVSENSLIIEAVPEGGHFRPEIENILYVLTSYPDGSPAAAELTLNFYDNGETIEVKTGDYGLAEIKRTPLDWWQGFSISAEDDQGNQAYNEFYFEGDYAEESILLRPDKAVYRVGESMQLSLLASQQSGSIYLDMIREGQTVSTRSVDLQNGQAELVVDLTPDLYGTLELHAYKILSSGSIVRDTRLVVVDQADTLDILTSFNKEEYLPGENAELQINIEDTEGSGVQSALGLAVVDEAVFALAEQDPGFAKLYFLLEQEILEPRYELHGFGVADIVSGLPIDYEPTIEAVETTAKASLSEASAGSPAGFSLQANSRDEHIEEAYQIQQSFYNQIVIVFFVLFILLSLVLVGLNIAAVIRERIFGRSLLLLLGVLALIILLFWVVPLLFGNSWVSSPLDGLQLLVDFLSYNGEGMLFLMAAQAVLGMIALLVVAIRNKEALTGWILFLLVMVIFVLVGMIYTGSMGNPSTPDIALMIGLIIFALLPLALLLRAAGYAFEKRALPSLALLFIGAFLLTATLFLMSAGNLFSTRMLAINQAFDMDAGVVWEEAAVAEEAVMEMAPMAAMDTMAKGAEGEVESPAAQSGSEAPRLRQYFPETMLWLPDAVTDEDGQLDLEFPVADSITTWRLTALASSQDGQLGSVSVPLRVFQDFFVDLDLPLSLTVGDQISVPVGIYNYLPEAQEVSLELKQEDWFSLLDQSVKTITIESNDISVVYFRIQAKDFGLQPLQVTAIGSEMSDAILKEVRVYPDGKEISFSDSDRLESGEPAEVLLNIPAEAISGTQKLNVKIYPGVVSQIVEGLDSLLQMPYGCFEQTSSTTYPNILVLDYMKSTQQISPEVQIKAEEYINLGYQRLLTFEVGGSGGFSLFGDAPADPMLTAYGLQEFNDMSQVYNIDRAVIERIVEWLRSAQNSDGSWKGVEGFHESGLTGQVDRLPVTAYVVWGLADAGFADDLAAVQGAEYLREYQSKAQDAYVLSLIANALVSMDMELDGKVNSYTQGVLERLADMAQQDGSSIWWENDSKTVMGSYGETGSLETTALAALAFLRSNAYPELANGALTFLVQNKDSFGTWQTTQATVMSLKAFLQSVSNGAEDVDARVTVTLNDGQTRTLNVTSENFDIVQVLSFDDVNIGRDNLVKIEMSGEGSLMYQASGSYYLPWKDLPRYPELQEGTNLVSIDLSYDRTQLSVNDLVEVSVKVSLNETGSTAESAIIDLGLPPGFSLQSEDLSALVTYYNDVPEDYAFPIIQRYEVTGRQIIIYIKNLSAEEPIEFSYHLLAEFPLRVQTPASGAYDYYNPAVSGENLPQTLIVNE